MTRWDGYQRLVDAALLDQRGGRAQPAPPCRMLSSSLKRRNPDRGDRSSLFCDDPGSFDFLELLDHAGRMIVVPRVTRWSEAAADIRAWSAQMAKDGAVERRALVARRSILQASQSTVSRVENDDSGATRKRLGSSATPEITPQEQRRSRRLSRSRAGASSYRNVPAARQGGYFGLVA